MALPNPDELDYFRRGEVFPALAGKDSTLELDYFQRGEVFPFLLPTSVAAVVVFVPRNPAINHQNPGVL